MKLLITKPSLYKIFVHMETTLLSHDYLSMLMGQSQLINHLISFLFKINYKVMLDRNSIFISLLFFNADVAV